MQLNSLIFPAPISSYSPQYNSNLLWIPKPSTISTLPPATISNQSAFKSNKNKINFNLKLDFPSITPFEEISNPELSTNQASLHRPSLKRGSLQNNRRIKDFGSHNALFSVKSSSSLPKKTMSFFTNPLRKKPVEPCQNTIPCLYYEYPEGSNILLVHFHANAEDIGDSYQYMRIVGSILQVPYNL